MSVESLYQAIQGEALPGVWSRGVALSRNANGVKLIKKTGTEWKVRVVTAERVAQPTVTLWLEDDDWHCDCGDRADPCPHIVTAILAAKADRIVEEAAAPADPTLQGAGRDTLAYRFSASGSDLKLERVIVRADGQTEPLKSSLVSYLGGLQSGRVDARPVNASKEDFAIDQSLSSSPRADLPHSEALPFIIEKLDGHPATSFEGKSVTVHGKFRSLRIIAEDSGDQIVLRRAEDPQYPGERRGFSNGAVLIGDHLFPAKPLRWSDEERAFTTAEGKRFPTRDWPRLVEEVIPALRAKAEVEILTSRLPETIDLPVETRIEIDQPPGFEGALAVVARLVYGDPPVAEIESQELRLLRPGPIPHRDREAELREIRRLHDELGLRPGVPVLHRGDDAARFRDRLKKWKTFDRTSPSAGQGLSLLSPLSIQVSTTPLENGRASLELSFSSPELGEAGRVSASAIFKAWRSGQSFLSLGTQGWAPLPKDWLDRFGPQIEKLYLSRLGKGTALTLHSGLDRLKFATLFDEAQVSTPEVLTQLRVALEKPQRDDRARIREGVRADLRDYQYAGLAWLSTLREANLGGILADDMGLGKTLQAICASRGRTLVVCPASVLVAWREQLQQFYPSARVSLYHGTKRKLEPAADFTLVTYGILRQDLGILSTTPWETAILDEAQVIKNRDSQAARAAHQIQAGFKIALSGTPIENHLDDLLSILAFACPGALPLEESRELHADQIRRRIRPFVLRRLKRDVAPELPARTESILRCTFSEQERERYDGLAHATASEVSRWIQERTGQAAIQALESILRLRQACNHGALVPGSGMDPATPSAKIELLVETLKLATENGHRSLVFSQWTSFLNLIEPHLRTADLRFSRLDGQTRDRAAVVTEFQKDDGPDLLLISLKAGGTGLTLTAADHVYIVDPWWNPAVEAQAADRAHRIGQEKPVFIYRIVTEGTIEEKVLALQEQKRALVAEYLGENGGALPALDPTELLALL